MVVRVLTHDDINELELEGLGSLVRYIDQEPYNSEDLVHCDDCDFVSITNDPLDHMNRCPDCSQHAKDCAEEVEDHRRWYRAVAR